MAKSRTLERSTDVNRIQALPATAAQQQDDLHRHVAGASLRRNLCAMDCLRLAFVFGMLPGMAGRVAGGVLPKVFVFTL